MAVTIWTGLIILVLVGQVSILLLFRSLRSYASRKGDDLATKEDMGAITREVEKVRAEYKGQLEALAQQNKEQLEGLAQQNRLLLESVRQRHELRLAALDRRLAAHQDAYTLWWKLMGSIFDEQKIGETVMECQDWFVRNRLYLQPEVAQAFSLAYHLAFHHNDLVLAREQSSVLQENMQTVRRAGEVIIKAVELPGLREGEFQPLANDKNRQSGMKGT